jgi:DNA-binding NarL/FixJ family response regulator
VSTRLLLAEGHPLILAGVEHTLTALPEFEIVARTTRGSDVVRLAEEHEPDVLLLDVGLAPSVRTLLEQVHAHVPSLRLVAFGEAPDRSWVGEALRGGATGFVPKRTPPEELAPALIRAMNGTQLDEVLLDAVGVPKVLLTGREAEIVARAAGGETNRQIARALEVSETTVKSHLTSIHRKLGTESRDELVRAALQGGYAPRSSPPTVRC